ncbi:unnamed protein product [Gongylonema pulchrum]|uniref:Rab-GAP TBC domain-containing protein n=1 Tax=Gongylonema pulchrum TaxID=637853 RepID=A0A183DYL8_9BILA|nr:unnamed protein product [Gongylonema pulchrum]
MLDLLVFAGERQLILWMIVDLMPILADHREYSKSSYSYIPKMLELDDADVVAIRRLIEERLSDVWRWMETLMDRAEAQFRFGSALMASPSIAAVLRKEKKVAHSKAETPKMSPRPEAGNAPSTPVRRQDLSVASTPIPGTIKKDEQNANSSASLEDFFGYIMSQMRSHASENGDDVPIIEFNALSALAFVVDAYLSLIDMLEKLDAKIASGTGTTENTATGKEFIDMFQGDDEPASGAKKPTGSSSSAPIGEFFQRSNSLLYPGIATASSYHAFEHKCADSLALAERPQLLRPGIEKEEMFGLPVKHKTTGEHQKTVREHGAEHPAHQGLVSPWSNYQEMLPPSSLAKIHEEKETVTSSGVARPNVIVHSKSVSSESIPQGSGNYVVAAATALSLRDKSFLILAPEEEIWTFHEQLLVACGGEVTGSMLLSEMAGFSVRESQFRKKMDKFKAAQTKDLTFEIERDKHEMIAQTIRQLNMHYARRVNTSSSTTSSPNTSANVSRETGAARAVRLMNVSMVSAGNKDDDTPPLACHKVKVTFKNEPGEGSGVARSFYAAVADAFLTMKRLPTEAQILAAFGSVPTELPQPQQAGALPVKIIGNRQSSMRSNVRERQAILSNSMSGSGRRRGLRSRYALSASAAPFYSRRHPQLNDPAVVGEESAPAQSASDLALADLPPSWEPDRETLGERLLARIRTLRSVKFTSILYLLQIKLK